MEFLAYLTEGNVTNFLLLLLRFAGIVAFFPFFENQLINTQIKGIFIFWLTILFIPLVTTLPPTNMTILEFIIAGITEIMLGFLASFALQIVFGMISFGGELISFAMGLTIANAYDPVTGAQKPIVGQLLSLLALMIVLALDYHHLFLYFVADSIKEIPLGGFIYSNNYILADVQYRSRIIGAVRQKGCCGLHKGGEVAVYSHCSVHSYLLSGIVACNGVIVAGKSVCCVY